MNDSQELENYGRKFWQRFKHFRQIEVQEVIKGPFQYSNEAFVLLHDIELCYAAKAYYACLILAHSIIETHLRKVEGMPERGTAKLFKRAGIQEEMKKLSKIRNDIVHGNPNNDVKISMEPEDEEHLDQLCIEVFTLMHELPIRLQRLRNNG